MATIPLHEPVCPGKAGSVFFAAGFRPFFLVAALQAALTLPLWLAVYAGGVDLNLPFSPLLWHGHEMVFGFAGAAIGGFLLTAVPNWTNCRALGGWPLMVLFAVWLAGRAAFTLAGYLPAAVVMMADLSYVPLLAFLVGRPLVAIGKARNMIFLPILTLFLAANLGVHLDIFFAIGDGQKAILAGLGLVLLMIAIVGGRIVPSFTQNWLRMQGQTVELKPIAWMEKGGAPLVLVVAMGLHLALGQSLVAGGALLIAAAIHGLRLWRWLGWRTIAAPILSVLHLGYGWMVVGLGLLGLSSLVSWLPASAALHALTAGAVGTMIMAVMSRAALGHSGRPLVLAPAVVVAYALLSLGTVLRVVAPLVSDAQMGLTHAGGSLWALAWVLFAWVYFPILTKARADGRAG